MARQKGVLKLEGDLGDITFYKTRDGYLARQRGGIDGDRIKNDPGFQRTRENGREFARAGKAGKLLRNVFRDLLIHTADGRMTSRLMQVMMKVLQADATNLRGERNVIDGEVDLLRGFEFNADGALTTTFFAPFTTAIERAAGTLSVNIPAFIPANMISAPEGATHCKFMAGAASIDFEQNKYDVSSMESRSIVIGTQQEAAFALQNVLEPGSNHPLFLIFGISFYQQVNNQLYSLRNGAYNALAIVATDGNGGIA